MDSEVKHCQACEGGIKPLSAAEINKRLTALVAWQFDEINKCIRKVFEFKGYARTMAFVNAVAWIATVENHHPDLEVSFNRCVVKYQTHAAGGVTENDLLCAEKVEELLK